MVLFFTFMPKYYTLPNQLILIIFIQLQNIQSIKRSHMDQDYKNHYCSHQYLNPFTHYYNYWGHVYAHQQMWGLNQFSSQNSYKIQEQPLKIAHIPHSELLKTQQPSNNVEEQKKNPRFTGKQKIIKQLPLQKKTEKIGSKQLNEQKQNRNVYSNILRNFFRKINDPSKIKGLLKSIIKRRNLDLTVEEFVLYVKRLKINHGRYLRFKRLRHLFIDDKLYEHSMVFRILYQCFTKEDLLVQTLTSKKIGRWGVILHLKGARDLKRKLFY